MTRSLNPSTMQRHLALLVCTAALVPFAQAQGCLPDGIVLNTQAQVNSFPTDHPGCTTIEGPLHILQSNITNLGPLAQITAVNGFLWIGANPQLTNLSGLDNITSVGGTLGVSGNAQLTDISALSSITTVGAILEVSENNNLTSLVGLQGITNVGSYLEISDSPGLTNLQGLEGIQTIGGSISINENAALASMQGLSPSSVGGGFNLMNNPQLMDLSAASGLTSLGGVLSLIGNTSILSLEELSGITAVNGLVRVMGSSGLMSLAGLENIDPTTILNLIIVNNPGLFQCAVESLCDYLAIPASLANITGNATGCASRVEVEDACVLLSVYELGQADHRLVVFPNPSQGLVQLKFNGQDGGLLNVFDMAGRSVHAQRFIASSESSQVIDLSHLPPGIYTLHIQDADQKFTTRFVRH
jgi:hypothetical protein